MLLAYLKIRWKILSLVGLLSALVAVVATRGIASMVIYQERIARQNEADARALYAEHVNSLIYAVVMDSRGVYMSDSTAAGQRFGQGVLGYLKQMRETMDAWRRVVPAGDLARFEAASRAVGRPWAAISPNSLNFIKSRSQRNRRGSTHSSSDASACC